MGDEGQIEKPSPILPQSLLGEGQTPKEGPSQRRSGPSSPVAPGEPAIERRPPSCLDGTRKCAPGSPSFQRCPGSEVAAAAERPCEWVSGSRGGGCGLALLRGEARDAGRGARAEGTRVEWGWGRRPDRTPSPGPSQSEESEVGAGPGKASLAVSPTFAPFSLPFPQWLPVRCAALFRNRRGGSEAAPGIGSSPWRSYLSR